MGSNVRKFLSADERLAVEARVKVAESATSGEIVVMVVSSSDHYHAAALAGSMAGGIVTAAFAAFVAGSEGMWTFLGFFAVLFVLLNEIIKRNYLLKRLFVSGREMTEAVEASATRSFYMKKVHETRERTGVLIYISLFERKVRILADSGINAKVPPQGWQEVAGKITAGIAEHRQAEVLCEAIDHCAGMLGKHFPRRDDDINELGDAVIMEE